MILSRAACTSAVLLSCIFIADVEENSSSSAVQTYAAMVAVPKNRRKEGRATLGGQQMLLTQRTRQSCHRAGVSRLQPMLERAREREREHNGSFRQDLRKSCRPPCARTRMEPHRSHEASKKKAVPGRAAAKVGFQRYQMFLKLCKQIQADNFASPETPKLFCLDSLQPAFQNCLWACWSACAQWHARAITQPSHRGNSLLERNILEFQVCGLHTPWGALDSALTLGCLILPEGPFKSGLLQPLCYRCKACNAKQTSSAVLPHNPTSRTSSESAAW